jgi:hypothetical protein
MQIRKEHATTAASSGERFILPHWSNLLSAIDVSPNAQSYVLKIRSNIGQVMQTETHYFRKHLPRTDAPCCLGDMEIRQPIGPSRDLKQRPLYGLQIIKITDCCLFHQSVLASKLVPFGTLLQLVRMLCALGQLLPASTKIYEANTSPWPRP